MSDFITWLDAQPFSPDDVVNKIINIGLPSETISGLSEENHASGRFPRPDLHERLQRVLNQYKPDLIYACYGMNCGILKSFDESRFKAYKEGILKLKKEAEAVEAKVIFITPPYFDQHGKPSQANYTDVLRRYSAWLVSMRKESWEVIDLHSDMTAAIKARQTLEPRFTCQSDRVHPNATGHRFMAQSLIDFYAENTQPTSELITRSVIDPVKRKAIHHRMNELKLAWLTAIGHNRPGIPKGKPLKKVIKTK